jgi:hypothetical protein
MSRLSRKLLLLGPHWSGGDSVALTFLLDVVFADYANEVAPLTSPIVGRSGSLVVLDVGSLLAIQSGALYATSTPAGGDSMVYFQSARDSSAGFGIFTSLPASAVDGFEVGYSDGTVPGDDQRYFPGPYKSTSTLWRIYMGHITPFLPTPANNAPTTITLVGRNYGYYLFFDEVMEYATYYQHTDTASPLLAVCHPLTGGVDVLRVVDLPANNYTVFGTRDLDLCTPGTGTGTSKIAIPAAGNTFKITPDVILQVAVPTPSTAGTMAIRCRNIDNDNFLYLRVDGVSQQVGIRKKENGIFDTLLTGSALVGGEILTLACNGDSISLWINDTLQGTVVDDIAITSVDGLVEALGNGDFANLAARTLDGVANVSSANHPGYGLATDVLPGPRAAADTFTHEADCVIIFDLPAIPSSGTLEFWFRSATVGTDGWRVTVDSSGDVDLDEVVSGTPTQRGTSAAAVSGGEHMYVICDDETIKVFADNSLLINYGSAATQKTQTAGEIEALGTGGRISNVVPFPRDFSSAPNTGGAADAAAALALLGA